MWHLFLDHPLSSASFFPLTLKPPQTSTSILILLGGQVMEQFYDNRWFKGKWLPFHQLRLLYRGQHYLAGVVPYLSSCMIWAPLWANTFASYCDNQAVLPILSAKSFIIPCVMNLVWLITFQTLSFNFTFTARHVPQINGIADSLSRFQMSLFRLLDQMHFHASSLSDPYIFQQSLTMQAA